jgi:NAD(P)-dependent dehydrogenase (short-subunit alcohol dehydrogenase family)
LDLQLQGKRALVTGSSSGIGAGIAQSLAAEGALVIIHGRDEARANAIARTIRAGGGHCAVALGELSTAKGAARVAESVQNEFKGLDILVNNAGGKTTPGNPGWLEVTLDDWSGTYQQNVGAAVRMIQHFAPGMRTQGWGRIIQIASASATQTEPGIGEYQAAKAALVNLSSSLARSLAHTGITVNTVSPGFVVTPASEGWLTSVAQQERWGEDRATIERHFTRERIPLCVSRLGRPEDIGNMVAFLASPLAGYISGANFRVDGGQCRSVN